jgi:hypothetical protein
MARQTVAGSIRNRKAIAVYPDPGELEAIEHLADQWQCSLGQAAMRLVRIGIASPDTRQPSDRATVVYGHLAGGRSCNQIHEFTSSAWGLNRKQTDQLIAEASAQLQKDWDMDRAAFTSQLQDQLHKFQEAAAGRSDAAQINDKVRQLQDQLAPHQSRSITVKSSSSC